MVLLNYFCLKIHKLGVYDKISWDGIDDKGEKKLNLANINLDYLLQIKTVSGKST